MAFRKRKLGILVSGFAEKDGDLSLMTLGLHSLLCVNACVVVFASGVAQHGKPCGS